MRGKGETDGCGPNPARLDEVWEGCVRRWNIHPLCTSGSMKHPTHPLPPTSPSIDLIIAPIACPSHRSIATTTAATRSAVPQSAALEQCPVSCRDSFYFLPRTILHGFGRARRLRQALRKTPRAASSPLLLPGLSIRRDLAHLDPQRRHAWRRHPGESNYPFPLPTRRPLWRNRPALRLAAAVV